MPLRRSLRALAVTAAVVVTGLVPVVSQAAEDELVVNGDFAAGTASWNAAGGIVLDASDGRLCTNVPATTVDPWEAGISQRDIPIVAGEHYRLRFTASASQATTIMTTVRSRTGTAPYEIVRQPQLTTEPQTFEYVFTALNSNTVGNMQFQLGAGSRGQAWSFCVDDVSLVRGVASPGVTGGDSFIEQFDGSLDHNFWYANDGFNNGSHQNCQFNKDKATTADGLLTLTLDDTPYGDRTYSCGAIQSNERYGYGTYETRMKIGAASGTNSSLFSYIGSYQQEPWMEIDVEALGKDPTKVEFNSWVNGDSKGPGVAELGYDGSAEWVDYAYVWEPTSLRFYIDGELKHTFTGADVPTRNQYLFTMLWGTDTLTSWMGPFEYTEPIRTQYDYVAFTRLGDECPFEGSVACDIEAPTTSFVDDFDTFNTNRWFVSDGWNNGAHQVCTWDRDQVAATGGALNLSFAKVPTGDREYACSEVQHRNKLGYGTYEVSVQGVAGSGLVTSLFTWIGASGGLPSETIDLAKLLGVDTSRVKFDVQRNGSLQPTFVDLPAPSDQGFTDYAVDWAPEHVNFYVNGELALSITDPAKIPTRDTTVFLSLWGGTGVAELGPFVDPGATVTAKIDRFAYTEPGDECQFAESVVCGL